MFALRQHVHQHEIRWNRRHSGSSDLEPIQVLHVLAEPICLGSANMSIHMNSDGRRDTPWKRWRQSHCLLLR